jgi:hypothetical protein
LTLALIAGLALAQAATACEICSVYTFLDAKESPTGWSAGLFVQSQTLDTLLDRGDEIDNEAGESIDSLATQVFVGYQWSRRWGVQVNVPYLSRDFVRVAPEADHEAERSAAGARPEHGATLERGSETGLGDVAVLVHYRALERRTTTSVAIVSVYGGAELPTGDSDRLAEAHDHAEASAAERLAVPEHGSGESAVGGHDLALGSGSTDGILGANLFWARGRAKVEVGAQYALRRAGDHDYRIGNEWTWSIEPGWFALLGHRGALGIGLQVNGEDKSEDEHAGERLEGTDLRSILAGPTVFGSWGERWFGKVTLDLPISQDSSGLLLAADRRWRASATVRF